MFFLSLNFLMRSHLSGVELVHVEPAAILAIQLVAAVAAIVLVVAHVLLVHALPIAAVLATFWARLDLAHEWQKCLASGKSPLLPSRVFGQKRFHTASVSCVRLLLSPVAVVLADLRTTGGCQCVRLQLILGLVAQPVGVLGVGGLELLLGELAGEVVLAEGGDGDEVGAVPLAKLARLLPGVADREKLVAV